MLPLCFLPSFFLHCPSQPELFFLCILLALNCCFFYLYPLLLTLLRLSFLLCLFVVCLHFPPLLTLICSFVFLILPICRLFFFPLLYAAILFLALLFFVTFFISCPHYLLNIIFVLCVHR